MQRTHSRRLRESWRLPQRVAWTQEQEFVNADSIALDRKQESEADFIGLRLMAQAGYDPREALAFGGRMTVGFEIMS